MVIPLLANQDLTPMLAYIRRQSMNVPTNAQPTILSVYMGYGNNGPTSTLSILGVYLLVLYLLYTAKQ